MTAVASEYARFFRADDIAPLECLDARFVEHVFAPHFHEEYVVNTLREGVQTYHYQGSVHRAGRGALVLVNPGVVHTGEAGVARGWAYRGFYPSAAFMRGLAGELTGQAQAEPFFRDTVVLDPDLNGRLEQLYQVLSRSDDRLLRESLLYAVFGDVIRRHMQLRPLSESGAGTGLARARTMLADRLADNLSLQELAQEAGLSPYHLSRAFHQAYGLPPIAWRNQLRVVQARGWLAQGLAPAEVAARVGFADQSHLTRQFRRALGITPGAYQQAVSARSFKTIADLAS
jgi:AraC-like DNA-binding protein